MAAAIHLQEMWVIRHIPVGAESTLQDDCPSSCATCCYLLHVVAVNVLAPDGSWPARLVAGHHGNQHRAPRARDSYYRNRVLCCPLDMSSHENVAYARAATCDTEMRTYIEDPYAQGQALDAVFVC